VNNKINEFVGNILQNKFYIYGYILLSCTRRCTPICGAGMLLRCNWCRNLDAVKLHTAGVGMGAILLENVGRTACWETNIVIGSMQKSHFIYTDSQSYF